MPDPADFAPTRWSLIATLRSGEATLAEDAMETLCCAYWYPLYAYARRCGHGPEDSADLTQAFFAHLIEKEILRQAEAGRGRLRTFLLTAMQNFLCDDWRRETRLKRGGGKAVLSFDAAAGENLYVREPTDALSPEILYHRRWALTLLDRTLTEVAGDYARRGQATLFEVLKPTLAGEPNAGSSMELGKQLGMEPGAVRVAIFRLRGHYRERLLAEVAASMDARTEAELDEEINALFRALSSHV